MDVFKSFIDGLAGAGPAVLMSLVFIWVLNSDGKERDKKYHDLTKHIIEENRAREEKCQMREEQSALREANYQRTINELVKKFDMIEEVQESFQEMQKDIEIIKENLEK